MPTLNEPDAIAPALTTMISPKPTSAAPVLNANTPSLSTRSRTAVTPRRSTSTFRRASMLSAAPLTFTVVADAIMSPTSPVTLAVASRSANRYALIRPSSTLVTTTTATSGNTSTAAARGSARPSTKPAMATNTAPPDTSTTPSISSVTSSVSSRKWVNASPAEPTG